jgi:hypothetical protein
MNKPDGALAGGLRPAAYLVLGYCVENLQDAKQPAFWANLKDMSATLVDYVHRKSLPFELTLGHIKATLLMLEGGYVSIERDQKEAGRNLEHPFKIRVNPSGKALFEQLAGEIGYPLKNISGPK